RPTACTPGSGWPSSRATSSSWAAGLTSRARRARGVRFECSCRRRRAQADGGQKVTAMAAVGRDKQTTTVPGPGARAADPTAPFVSLPLRDPEVALMLRVQRDEPGAFEELIERYWSRVFGHFFRRLGDRQEAEDLAQDVFLRLYRYRKRY